jgi:hypothetical protein
MKSSDLFIFAIPSPRIRRGLALGSAVIFLLIAAWIPLAFGLSRFPFVLRAHPALWWLFVESVVAIALFLRLAFPPQSTLARLEFCRDCVSFIPDRMTRRLFADPVIRASITPQSREILFCHSIPRELQEGYGYTVKVCAADKSERSIKAGYLTLHNAKENERFAKRIASVTDLPVRFITRRRLANGTVEESPWTPPVHKAKILIATVAFGAVPYIGGIAVGYLWPHFPAIFATGLCLWFCQLLAMYACADHKATRYSAFYALSTIFTFAAAYGVTACLVAYIFRRF